jgi:hypothetical protein
MGTVGAAGRQLRECGRRGNYVRRTEGEDRYSQKIFLSYGKYGFYFDEPGTYMIRALYQGPGNLLIPSNMHRIRVGQPASQDADRLGQDFFSYQVGMSLYLGGSASPFLTKGMEVLRDLGERFQSSLVGAKAATTVAKSVAEPFFRIAEADEQRTLVKTQPADPAEALTLTDPALKLYQSTDAKTLNIDYHNLVRTRAGWLVASGDSGQAQQEVANRVRIWLSEVSMPQCWSKFARWRNPSRI